MPIENKKFPSQKEVEEAQNNCREFLASLPIVRKTEEEINHGKWNQEQNLKFVIFLDFHRIVFTSKKQRREQNFQELASFIQTRTASQCKNHLRAPLKRHQTIKKIILYHKKAIGQQEYRKNCQFLRDQLQNPSEQSEQPSLSEQKQFASVQIQTDPIPLETKQLQCKFSGSLWASLFQNQYSQYKYGINFHPKFDHN